MNATNLRVLAAILFLMLFVWLFGSCGKGGSSTVHRSTATGAQQATKGHTRSLQEVISQIDSYPVPKGVSAALWATLTSKLKQEIVARSADGKTISTTATGALNAVSNLAASSNGAGTQATVTWTEKLGGDCNNDAQVDIADLQPIAAHYGETSSGPGSAAYLADADGSGEVGITDLQPIAADYSMHIEGYEVWRGAFNGTTTTWEGTIRPNTNPANANWSADRTATPPAMDRPAYIYLDDISGLADKTNVRYKVMPYGDGAEGVESNIATMPPPGTTFTVNGTVTYLSNGLGGVTMTLMPGGQSTVTAADGTYTIPGVANGSYTLTPSLSPYTFTPNTRSITVAGADLVNEDFTASQGGTTYNVKGTVTYLGNGLSGVLLTLTGGLNATTVADGTYTITGVSNGSYTLTPTKTGYSFSPATRSVNVSGADSTGNDFTATTTSAKHTVSGTVTDGIVGVSGVTMFLSPGFSATTQADGTYSIPNVPDGNYSLLPVNSRYTYAPAGRTVSMSGADITGQDFTAATTGLPDGSAWPKFGNDVRNTGFSPYVGAQTNAVKWTLTSQTAIQGGPAIAADGTVYIGGYDGTMSTSVLYALNPADGSVNWKCDTVNSPDCSPAIGGDGTIYIGDTGYILHAITPLGVILWNCGLAANAIWSSPAIAPDGTIYFGDDSGEVFALNPADGSQIWKSILPSEVRSCPAIAADGTIYVGCDDFNIYALDPLNGNVKWSYLTDGYVDYPGAIGADGTIYFASHGGSVYALTPSLALKWTVQPSGSSVDCTPAIGPDGTIYVGSYTDLYALNPSNGSTKWDYTTFANGVIGSAFAIGADGTIYFGATDDNIYAVNGSSGVEKWRRSAADSVMGSPAIGADGTVYIGSNDNKLYAIGP